jgi:hypothetical protein
MHSHFNSPISCLLCVTSNKKIKECEASVPENSGGRMWISKEFGRKIFQECPIPEKTKSQALVGE